jgi:hypothetical protein
MRANRQVWTWTVALGEHAIPVAHSMPRNGGRGWEEEEEETEEEKEEVLEVPKMAHLGNCDRTS